MSCSVYRLRKEVEGTQTIFIGIDPGLTGALVAINDQRKILFCDDAPTLQNTKFNSLRREYDRLRMVDMLREILHKRDEHGEPFACMEKVNAMPNTGSIGNFSLGQGFGIWLGILATLKVPIDLVHSKTWKKAMMPDMGKEKQASIIRAKELFPADEVFFRFKYHHGRADALLIAEWRRRQENFASHTAAATAS